jgi:hypothetical protein
MTCTHKSTVIAVAALFAAISTALALPVKSANINVSGYAGSTPLANFPVLVRISPLLISGFAYADCAADGRDIAFKDAQGNALAREIDTWNTSGESLVWVSLPVCTNNASFVMTWGDASVASQPACQTDGSVWTAAGYVGVWHMSEASGTVADATAHGLTATPGGNYTTNSIAVSGKIGNARRNAASADQPGNLVVPNYNSFNVGDTFAVGGWFNLTDNSASDNRFFSRKKTYTDNNGWEIMHKGGQANLKDRKINLRGPGKDKTIQSSSGIDIAGTGWQHFLFVYDGSSATIYHNGAVLASSGTTILAATDNGQALGIGSYREAAASCIVGDIDECRLLDAVPSTDWIAADYATQSDANFLTYGQAEILAAEGAINIRGNPANIGSPSPAYGLHTAVSEIAFSMPVTAVAGEGTVSNFLAGWTLDGVDIGSGVHTRLHSSSDPGASISSFTYVRDVPYAEFTWIWEARDALGVSQPSVTRVETTSANLSIAVSGIGYEGFPSLSIAYGTSPGALDTTNVVAASVTAPGVIPVSLSSLEQNTVYYARAILAGPGGFRVDSPAVSFTTYSTGLHFFLNEDATGACDGSSWTDAFTSWSDALAAVRASGNAGLVTLHIAKGIYNAPSTYPIDSNFPTAITNAQFAIYGGCRAAYHGDLERDPETYQTFVTTAQKANVLSAYWKRIEPTEDGYGYTDTPVSDGNSNFTIIDAEGRLRIPAFTGAHDTFTSSHMAGYIPVFIGAGAGGTIDGLRFICCSRDSSRNGIIRVEKGAGDVDITNCVFVASNPQGGCIVDNGGRTSGVRRVTDCKFLFNRVSWGTVGVTSLGGTIVRDCLFLGTVQTTDNAMTLFSVSQGAAIDNAADGADRTAEDCVFTRNFTSYLKPGDTMIANGGVLRRCVITNNWFATRQASATILVNLGAAKNFGTGMMEDCLIADNTALTIPTSGSKSIFVAGYNKDRNSTPAIVNTVFRDNAFLAPSNTVSAQTTCAFGIVGNRAIEKSSTWMTVQGCTFISNRVEVSNLAEGATALRSRGLFSYNEASSRTAFGFANCTFFGPAEEGLYDVVQSGPHTDPLNIVNCVFALDNPNAVADPFLSDVPGTINLHGCAVQNWYDNLRPTDFGAVTALKIDPLPLVAVAKGPGDGFVLRPAAWTPGLRETCDVATNAPPANTGYAFYAPSYSFRLPGGEWQRLLPQTSATDSNVKSPDADSLGTTRAFGSYTAGAVQSLTPAAETGSTLTLRRDPFAGGTLSVPFVQSAAPGDAYTPVTAIPASGGGFNGWLDENGDLFSAANPLSLVAAQTNITLTASFGTAAVYVIFDLGPYGTFDENGESTISVVARAEMPFPEIPAFTILAGHHFAAWSPAIPATVPAGGATYTATVVSTELRRFHVAPDGTGDGSSWANAANLADAYTDAASYRGELWLKEGVYTVATPIPLRSNVAVVGGFAGGETSADAADPAAHPVVINGNVSGGLYWKPNGTDPGVGNRTPVWENGVFNEPNPGWADDYWQPASPNAAADATYAFEDSLGGGATNVLFRGVTFTGFSRSAIYSISRASDGISIENCRFLANGTGASTSYSTLYFDDASLSVRDCDFIGNFRGLRFTIESRLLTNAVANCRFLDNVFGAMSVTLATNGTFDIASCQFLRNYSGTYNNSDNAPALRVQSSYRFGLAHVTDCVIASNIVSSSGGGCAVVTVNTADPANYAALPSLAFERCDFTDNIGRKTRGTALMLSNRYGSLQFRDCNFLRNVLAEPQGGTPPVGGIVYDDTYAVSTFVNCLFEKNTAYAKDKAGVFLVHAGDYRRGALINCTFADNDITAEDPLNAADFRVGKGNGIGAFKVVNCVFDESASGHYPIRCDVGAKIDLWDVFTRGQTTNTMGAATFGLVNGYGPIDSDPRLQKRSKPGPGGRIGRTVSGSSPASRGGLLVQLADNGNYFVHCPWLTAANAKPWCAPSVTDLTLSAGAALGLDPASASIPDAWGQARPAGKPIAAGHLNAARAETMIILQ